MPPVAEAERAVRQVECWQPDPAVTAADGLGVRFGAINTSRVPSTLRQLPAVVKRTITTDCSRVSGSAAVLHPNLNGFQFLQIRRVASPPAK